MGELDLKISNTLLRDWEDLCPLQWKARHIDKTLEWTETQPMRWGTYFEQLVIGSGVKGKTIELTDAEKKSVYYERVKAQAKDCRRYLKMLGGKILRVQHYYEQGVYVVDSSGQQIPIMGGLDIEYRMPDGTEIVIDLKLTGDADNDFGKFAWGSPEKMDVSQLIHYGAIKHHQTGVWPETQYWVFDSSAKMRQKLIRVNISEEARAQHIERVSKAYNEIVLANDFLGFQPKNSFGNCQNCPLNNTCIHATKMPELIQIEAWVPQPLDF